MAYVHLVSSEHLGGVKMARRKIWKKGKVFSKGRKKVRYIYPNGKKKGRKLVSASGRRRR